MKRLIKAIALLLLCVFLFSFNSSEAKAATTTINTTSDTNATQPTNMKHVVSTSDGTTHAFVQVGTESVSCGGSLSGLLWFNSTDDGDTWTCQGQLSSDTTNFFYADADVDSSDNIYVVYSVTATSLNSAHDVYYRKLTKGGGSSWTLENEQTLVDGDGTNSSYSQASVAVEGTSNLWFATKYYDSVKYQAMVYYSNNQTASPSWTSDYDQTIDQVWSYVSSSYSDETIDMGDVGTADVQMVATTGDILYFGSTSNFTGVSWTLSTIGVGGNSTWEYWNGSSWTSLPSYSGNNTSFTSETNGSNIFSSPYDWATTSINGEGSAYYYIRARATGVYTTPPVGSWGMHTILASTEQTQNGTPIIESFGDGVGLMTEIAYGSPSIGNWYDFLYRYNSDTKGVWIKPRDPGSSVYMDNFSMVGDANGHLYLTWVYTAGTDDIKMNVFDSTTGRWFMSYPAKVENDATTLSPVSVATDGLNAWFFYKDELLPDSFVYRRGSPPFDMLEQSYTDISLLSLCLL